MSRSVYLPRTRAAARHRLDSISTQEYKVPLPKQQPNSYPLDPICLHLKFPDGYNVQTTVSTVVSKRCSLKGLVLSLTGSDYLTERICTRKLVSLL